MHPLLLNVLGVLAAIVLAGLGVGAWLWVVAAVNDFQREVGDTELADALAKALDREKQKDAEIARQKAVIDAQMIEVHRMTAECARFQTEIRSRLGIYRHN